MEIKEQKKRIRKEIATLKRLLPAGEKALRSSVIMEQVEQLPGFQKAQTVLLYYSLPDEVQTEFFLQKWTGKKRLVLPVVEGKELILKEYTPGKTGKGHMSINEPVGTTVIEPSQIEFAVIPGVAFDAACNRLGRGGGFYDRLLPQIKCATAGVGYHLQVVEKIPVEAFDKPLDMVITEEKRYGIK